MPSTTSTTTYEAWIEGPKGTRIVGVEAAGIKAAHDKAVELCGEDEFVRGVQPL